MTSDEELRADLIAIAQKMAAAFADALDAGLADIAHRYEMTDAELDGRLPGIEIAMMAVDTPSAGSEVWRIRPFQIGQVSAERGQSSHSDRYQCAFTHFGFASIQSVGKRSSHPWGQGALKAAAHKSAIAGAKAAGAKAATAAAVKTGEALAGGPFVLAAIAGVVVWEWWDHTKSVAEQKPTLLRQIDEGFAAYEAALLDVDGQLGSILMQMGETVRARAVQ